MFCNGKLKVRFCKIRSPQIKTNQEKKPVFKCLSNKILHWLYMLAVSQDIVINFHRARILGIFVGPPILYQHCPLHNLTRRRGSRLKLKLTHFAAALLIHSPIFCVDFLICRNCRMYLFNLQSYLKNYTLCTPPPYPPMIVPC